MIPPSPQLENGFTRLANELLEALARINLSAYEWRTLVALWRKTYGFQKKEDRISVSQFQKVTGLDRRHQVRALSSLERRKIIVKNDNGFIHSYSFEKDHSKWATVADSGNSLTVADSGNTLLPIQATKPLPIQAPTKEKRKHTKEKGSPMPSKKEMDAFIKNKAEEIYELYPRKAKRKDSLRSIEKLLRSYPAELGVCPVPGLKAVVENYRHQIEDDGTQRKYIIFPNNFFGEAERWREFITTTTRSEPESPFARNFY